VRECESARVRECESARVRECDSVGESARVRDFKWESGRQWQECEAQEGESTRMRKCKSAERVKDLDVRSSNVVPPHVGVHVVGVAVDANNRPIIQGCVVARRWHLCRKLEWVGR
jgi:hypothetical protein